MKRSPFSLSSPGGRFTRGTAGLVACAVMTAGVVASAGPASASRVAQVTPVTSCPSASSVSSAAGFTVPAASTNSYSNSGTSAQFGHVTTTGTICEYGAPSVTSMHFVILIFVKLSKAIATSQVETYIKSQIGKVNQKMPGGGTFHWRLGTLAGVTTAFMSGSESIQSFHMNFGAAIGYQGGKVAGAEGVNVTAARVNALAQLAFNKIGI